MYSHAVPKTSMSVLMSFDLWTITAATPLENRIAQSMCRRVDVPHLSVTQAEVSIDLLDSDDVVGFHLVSGVQTVGRFEVASEIHQVVERVRPGQHRHQDTSQGVRLRSAPQDRARIARFVHVREFWSDRTLLNCSHQGPHTVFGAPPSVELTTAQSATLEQHNYRR